MNTLYTSTTSNTPNNNMLTYTLTTSTFYKKTIYFYFNGTLIQEIKLLYYKLAIHNNIMQFKSNTRNPKHTPNTHCKNKVKVMPLSIWLCVCFFMSKLICPWVSSRSVTLDLWPLYLYLLSALFSLCWAMGQSCESSELQRVQTVRVHRWGCSIHFTAGWL